MRGFVLVSLDEAVDERKVLDSLVELEEVAEAHLVFGEWDILLKAECMSPALFSAFVLDKIRSIPEVKMTSTMIIAR
ncbi:MAG: Lrp/AsnC ligand binding domain-containing protein [Candidatus Nanoarchaeia archaeon]